MKFLLGLHHGVLNSTMVYTFLITFFVQLELFRIQETTKKNKLNKRIKMNKIKLNKFYPNKLNILNDIIKFISYFLKALLCPRLNWVN